MCFEKLCENCSFKRKPRAIEAQCSERRTGRSSLFRLLVGGVGGPQFQATPPHADWPRAHFSTFSLLAPSTLSSWVLVQWEIFVEQIVNVACWLSVLVHAEWRQIRERVLLTTIPVRNRFSLGFQSPRRMIIVLLVALKQCDDTFQKCCRCYGNWASYPRLLLHVLFLHDFYSIRWWWCVKWCILYNVDSQPHIALCHQYWKYIFFQVFWIGYIFAHIWCIPQRNQVNFILIGFVYFLICMYCVDVLYELCMHLCICACVWLAHMEPREANGYLPLSLSSIVSERASHWTYSSMPW